MPIPLLAPLLILAGGPAPGYTAAFVAPPRYVTESVALPVVIRYVAPERTTVRLELKTPQHVVLEQAAESVQGAGEVTLTVMPPPAAQFRQILLNVWMGDDWEKSPCGVVTAPPVDVLSFEETAMREEQREAADEQRAKLAGEAGPKGLAGIFQWPGRGPRGLDTELRTHLAALGLGAALLTPEMIGNEFVVTPDLLDILVVIDPSVLPGPSAPALARYAELGGDLMILGSHAFSRMLWPEKGRWLSREELLRDLVAELPGTVRLDFEATDFGEWKRATNDLAHAAGVTRAGDGAHGSTGCAEIRISNLTGWDTFTAPLAEPFAPGEEWLSFWAKGARATRLMAIELTERDGSRWIGTVPLTSDWQRFVLPPAAFPFWHDSGSRGRGGPGDTADPANVVSVTFGLAHTHTPGLSGEHVIWLDDIGATPEPPNGAQILEVSKREMAQPRIEAVSPGYKLYPVTNLAALTPDPKQVLLQGFDLTPPAATSAPHRRPNGTGFGKGRRWRQQPLIECRDAAGTVCGTPVSLTISGADQAAGGITISVPVEDDGWLAERAETWAELAARAVDGLFLYEGGSAYYATSGDEAMPVGAVVTNRGKAERRAVVRIEVSDGEGRWVWGMQQPVTAAPGAAATVQSEWPIPAGTTGKYTVVTTLTEDGATVDRLEHEVLCWQPPAEPDYITARDGDFWLGGRKWYAHGVNYMPSSGIGAEDGTYFEHWIGAAPYDPDIIERDLADCEAIGFNMVSVFQYRQSMESRNLLDLLIRCRAHGLRVNLSLRPGTPLDFPWDIVRDMIAYGRLAEHDTVFAYDLAWEPQWGNHVMRLPWDDEWSAWVGQAYGGVPEAEAVWGCAAPREDGRLTNPTDAQASDPAYAKLCIDYRRFLKELLHERYGRARELVRSIDPHHAVSFRMSEGGNPTVPPSWIAYDFQGLAQAVDLYEPEGYGRIGDWEKVKPGWFTAAYARAANPALPVMWAEFGYTSWDMATMSQDPERLDFIARFYEDFYQMAYRSGANGTVCWWFPGGFRVGENSDYGIQNPDRSWREITRVIHRWSEKFQTPRELPRPDVWLTVPSDHPQGIWGCYQDVSEEFWAAIAAGRTPGLRFEPATE